MLLIIRNLIAGTSRKCDLCVADYVVFFLVKVYVADDIDNVCIMMN